MITYEVQLETSPAFASRLERYMRKIHIPEILTTGCFAQITFERTSSTRLRTRYLASTQADLDRYLNEHTAHFREDFMTHFPEGVTATRTQWEEVESWHSR